MKKVFFLVAMILLVFTTNFSAQAQNMIRTEVGYAFTGTGDIEGFAIGFDYLMTVAPRVNTSAGFNLLLFHADYEFLQQATVPAFEASAIYNFISRDAFALGIGGGAFARQWNWIYATGPDVSLHLGDKVVHNSYLTFSENTVGYTVLADASFFVSKSSYLSLRGSFQNDTGGNTVMTLRAGIALSL